MEPANQAIAIERLFGKNPAYQSAYLAAIAAASPECDEECLVSTVEAACSSLACIQTPYAVIESLVRAEALERHIFVDGEPYDGAPTDVFDDPSVGDNAVIDARYRATDAARAIAEHYLHESGLDTLLARNPSRARAFNVVLTACAGPEGATTGQLQALLHEQNLLEADERGVEAVHAGYFTGALEKARALVWRDGAWRVPTP